MRQYVLTRLFQLVVVMIGISIVTFMLTYVLGDPLSVLLPLDAPLEQRETFRRELGLDQPLPVQYARFASGAIRGDFGDSFLIKKSASALVLERFPATLQLALAGLGFAMLIAFPLGTIAAYRRGSAVDNLCTMLAVAGQAVPIYWLGLMLMIVLGVQLRLLPPSGYGRLENFIMPTIALGSFLAPITMRLVRSSMIDVLSQDYIRTARARELHRRIDQQRRLPGRPGRGGDAGGGDLARQPVGRPADRVPRPADPAVMTTDDRRRACCRRPGWRTGKASTCSGPTSWGATRSAG